MSNRQGKCPSCGLVNPAGAFECRCCGLALRARPRAKSPYETHPRGGKKGGRLLTVALGVALGGLGVWYGYPEMVRIHSESAPKMAEEAEAKPRKQNGPPSLSERRRTGDDGERGFTPVDMMRLGAERKAEFDRAIEEHERAMYGDKNSLRLSRESQRRMLEPSTKRQPVYLESQPPRDLTNDQ